MRRSIFGFLLLAALLVPGLLGSGYMARHSRNAETVTRAAALTRAGDAAGPLQVLEEARRLWQRSRDLSAVLTDQASREEADRLFAELGQYDPRQQPETFRALCVRLAGLLEAIGESHRLTWKNLF